MPVQFLCLRYWNRSVKFTLKQTSFFIQSSSGNSGSFKPEPHVCLFGCVVIYTLSKFWNEPACSQIAKTHLQLCKAILSNRVNIRSGVFFLARDSDCCTVFFWKHGIRILTANAWEELLFRAHLGRWNQPNFSHGFGNKINSKQLPPTLNLSLTSLQSSLCNKSHPECQTSPQTKLVPPVKPK